MVLQDVHNQEIKRYKGETREPPRQLHFKDGGGDLLVELKDLRQGWTSGITTKVSAYSNWISDSGQYLILFLDYTGSERLVSLCLGRVQKIMILKIFPDLFLCSFTLASEVEHTRSTFSYCKMKSLFSVTRLADVLIKQKRFIS